MAHDYTKTKDLRHRMISKEEARYRKATFPGRNCGNCSMFMDGGHCTLVKGEISPDMVCDHFSHRLD